MSWPRVPEPQRAGEIVDGFIGRAAMTTWKQQAQAFAVDLRLDGEKGSGHESDGDAGQKARTDAEQLSQEIGQRESAVLDMGKHRLSERRTLQERGDLLFTRLGATDDLLQIIAHAAAEEKKDAADDDEKQQPGDGQRQGSRQSELAQRPSHDMQQNRDKHSARHDQDDVEQQPQQKGRERERDEDGGACGEVCVADRHASLRKARQSRSLTGRDREARHLSSSLKN